MSHRARHPLRDGLVIAAISVALPVLAEIGLSVIFPRDHAPPIAREPTTYVPDPDCLVALKPDLRRTAGRPVANDPTVIHWATNHAGFRGPELLADPDLRVIVYGDSNIQATFSKLEDTYAHRLQRFLGESWPGKEIEVVNAGLVGSGPDQILIRLQRDTPSFKPNLVIVHIFADNDFGDLIRNRLFDVDAADRLVPTSFPREADVEFSSAASGNASPSLRGFLADLRLTRAAQRVARVFDSRSPHERRAMAAIAMYESVVAEEYGIYAASLPQEISHFRDNYDLDVAAHPDSESARIKLRLMRAVLRAIRDLTAAHRVELLVLIQPSIVDLGTAFTVSFEDLKRFPAYRRDALTQSVSRLCDELGIRSIDLFEPFLGNRPETLYFGGEDEHWNDAGQNLGARITADSIARAGIVERMLAESGRASHASRSR